MYKRQIAASAAQAESAASETLGFTYHNEHCLCNCMLQCTVRDGRLAMIQPRENEDKRFQNVCLKGISEVQNIYGDARIQLSLIHISTTKRAAAAKPTSTAAPPELWAGSMPAMSFHEKPRILTQSTGRHRSPTARLRACLLYTSRCV